MKKMTFPKAEKLADRALSLLLRKEYRFCQFHRRGPAWRTMPCRCSGPLQLCHKITRKNKALRYDRRNVFVGCSASNMWAHYNQLEWDKLWRLMWPEDELYLTHPKWKMPCKRSTQDLLQMAAYFDSERERRSA